MAPRGEEEEKTFGVAWLWRSTGLGVASSKEEAPNTVPRGKCCCNFHHHHQLSSLLHYWTALINHFSVLFRSLSTFEGREGIIAWFRCVPPVHPTLKILKQVCIPEVTFTFMVDLTRELHVEDFQ